MTGDAFESPCGRVKGNTGCPKTSRQKKCDKKNLPFWGCQYYQSDHKCWLFVYIKIHECSSIIATMRRLLAIMQNH